MAALALSSAARQLSRSSTIFMREVSGSHKLTIDGYSASRKLPQAWWAPSQAFEVAGYSWRILYFPNGPLVQKWALLPVGKSLQSRFFNREHQSGTKGILL